MKVVLVLIVAYGFVCGFFHIVGYDGGIAIIPKSSFTFSDTFISVEQVLARHNNQNLAEVLRGDLALSNLVRNLKDKGILVSSLSSASEWTDTSSPAPENPTLPYTAEVIPETTKILQNKSLGAYLGNPALEILKDELIKQNSMRLLGRYYDKFIANMEVSSELEMDSNYILGYGCSDNMCLMGQAAFAINRQTGEMIAVLVSSEDDHLFGVDSIDNLPGNLQSWYLDRKQEP